MDGQSSLQFYYSGYEKCEAAHSFGPAVRVHYLIHLVISGKGTYHVGKKAYSVCAHQAFLIRPQEVTFYTADKAEPKEYITLLRIEAAKNLLQHSKYSITDISAACGFHCWDNTNP